MSTETEDTALSADEQAFFNSGGETELPAQAEQPEQVAESEAPPAEAEQPNQPRDEKGKFVPLGALHEEREKRRALEQRQAILEDRWNTLLKVSQTEKKEEEAPPDPEVDIFAYAKWQAKQNEAIRHQLEQRQQQEEQQRQFSAEDQAIRQFWQGSVQEFSAQTPDFQDAASYLAGLRTQQLSALGLNQTMINQTIDNELKGVVKQAAQAGKSPAELIYTYAKVSGYKGKAPTLSDAEKKVQEIDAAQQRGKTISGQPGGQVSDPTSAEAIASMSQQEFDAWYSKPENQRRFQKLMGA